MRSLLDAVGPSLLSATDLASRYGIEGEIWRPLNHMRQIPRLLTAQDRPCQFYVLRIRSPKGWFPYDRRRSRIADRRSQKVLRSSAIIWKPISAIVCDRLRSCDRDRRRSQKIEPCSIFCDRLRSSAIVCDPAIIWKPKFCDLRSKRIP